MKVFNRIVLSMESVRFAQETGIQFHQRQYFIRTLNKSAKKANSLSSIVIQLGVVHINSWQKKFYKKVGGFLKQNFVNIKFDMDKPENASIISKYTIDRFPHCF